MIKVRVIRMAMDQPWKLILEPWGEIYEVDAEDVWSVSSDKDFEIEMSKDGAATTVWAGEGVKLKVEKNGEVIESAAKGTVPPVPPGFSIKQFVKSLFG